ncbi:MAG TPA: substrate-binding domain-containing protein, partial [Jatrophihabitans sp.]|nr:substrate-binding domain-containing protein [Jatrophihabitans sp.]
AYRSCYTCQGDGAPPTVGGGTSRRLPPVTKSSRRREALVLAAREWRRRAGAAAGIGAVLALVACGGGSGDGAGGGNGSGPIGITLVTKDPSNPFWVAMVDGAMAGAERTQLDLTIESGRDQTDTESQIQAIEDAISRGDKAILIAHNGPAVFGAIKKARDQGLFVLALDTPTDPVSLVDGTFASDNLEAGKLIGQWTAARFKDRHASIAMLDLFNDKIVSVDLERDHGFLWGMGIKPDPQRNGGEPKTGTHAGGGTYEVVCHGATAGAVDGGRSAMEKCLSVNPKIDVVFTANEASGTGAVQALKAAGIKDAVVTSIDGSCRGVRSVQSGDFGAVAQQFPFKMGELGVQAVFSYLHDGTKPTPTPGRDFLDTGVVLISATPEPGVQSITADEGETRCW